MRILSLYVSREYLKIFSFLIFAFVALYTLFDFIEKVDNFFEAGVAGSTMMMYFLLQVPELISLLSPLAVLLGTIISLGLMSKRGETIAVKSSGISVLRFTLPIILISLAITLGTAMSNELVVPDTKASTNYIWETLVERRPSGIYTREKFWYKGSGSIYHIGHFDPDGQVLSNVVYYRFDKNFNLAERIDARRAMFLGGQWVFFSGLHQLRLPQGGYSAVVFEEIERDLPERPSDFSRLSKPSEEMSLGELSAHVDKVDKEGYDTRRYRVDMHCKISGPFICTIMALLGIPLALFREKGRFLAPGIVVGLVLSLVYWVGSGYVRSIFGYAGILPPVAAAWLPNAIFALAGFGMITSIRQ